MGSMESVESGVEMKDKVATSTCSNFVNSVVSGNLTEMKRIYYANNINVNQRYQLGQTALFYAAFKGYNDIVDFLLRNNADMMIGNHNGSLPIHIACWKGYIKVVQMLIKHGANIHVLNNKNMSPFYLAVINGQVDVARLLIQYGANVNSYDVKNDLTLLHHVCAKGDLKMVQLLIENGATTKVAGNKSAYHPIHMASMKGHYKVVSYLLQHGVNPLEKGENSTPIRLAVYHNHLTVVDIFLDVGVNVNVNDKYGQQLIHTAAARGNSGIVCRLLQNGANINAISEKNGLTPLHLAVAYDNYQCVEMLLKYGANVDMKSFKGTLPVNIAKNEAMKKLLKKKQTVVTPISKAAGNINPPTTATTPSAPIMEETFKAPVTLESRLQSKIAELIYHKNKCLELDVEIELLNRKIEASTITSNQNFECPICFEIPLPPQNIFQCEQGHIFCGNCKDRGIRYCPECREFIADKSIRNRRLEDVIKNAYANGCLI